MAPYPSAGPVSCTPSTTTVVAACAPPFSNPSLSRFSSPSSSHSPSSFSSFSSSSSSSSSPPPLRFFRFFFSALLPSRARYYRPGLFYTLCVFIRLSRSAKTLTVVAAAARFYRPGRSATLQRGEKRRRTGREEEGVGEGAEGGRRRTTRHLVEYISVEQTAGIQAASCFP